MCTLSDKHINAMLSTAAAVELRELMIVQL